jgi:hypothetical protein
METGTDDYGLGEEVTSQVRVRKPVGIVVSTRLEREISDQLLVMSEATGKKLSQLLREAVLAYLERGPSQGAFSIGSHVSMGTFGGCLNAVFTLQNSIVTNSGLVEHTELAGR